MFKNAKKIDYNDIYNFLPDNATIGTSDFYRRKYEDKLPEPYYKYMESCARVEYTEEDKENSLALMREQMEAYNNALLAEYASREQTESTFENEANYKFYRTDRKNCFSADNVDECSETKREETKHD